MVAIVTARMSSPQHKRSQTLEVGEGEEKDNFLADKEEEEDCQLLAIL